MKTFKVSAIAILAAMLATAPASAASLNLGGGNGSLLNLGGSGSGANATVSVDAGGLLDGSAGGSSTSALLDVNASGPGSGDGLLLGDTSATAKVDLGGSTDSGTLLDLFGTGSGPTTASVDVGSSDGIKANVLLDLFGNGTDANAKLTIGTGENVAGLNGTNGDVLIDLFGNGGTSGGSAGNGAVGGGTGSGTGGIGGSGNFGSGNGGTAGSGTVGAHGLQVASIDGKATAKACFTPNVTQIAKLTSRHQYGPAAFSTWASVSSLKIVDIGLCTSAATTITGDPNIGRLQAFINANSTIRAGLAKQGHSPGDVIAVDKSGNTLVLYVI
jgi:hypothetical protein